MPEDRLPEANSRFDLRRLPGIPRIYADYLYDFPRVRPFYPSGPPFQLRTLEERARARQFPAPHRTALAGILSRQNASFESGAETQNHIDQLAQPQTVAIVAGQQIGLFGGPWFTVYKAMAAIRLAAELRAGGTPAVPIFWMATQDHDVLEISQACLLDAEDEIIKAQLQLPAPAGVQSVGKLVLDASIASTLAAAQPGLGAELSSQLAEYYRPGESLTRAFARCLAHWFRGRGLILLDPQDAGLAELARPAYRAAVQNNIEIAAALEQRNAALEQAGYAPQVQLGAGASLLFWERDQHRRHLRREDGRWIWDQDAMDEAELLARLEARPEEFSAAALLRPLVQDFLLPAVAQITGPAEAAYLGQSTALYGALTAKLGLLPPLPWPRPSLTVTDAKSRRLLERYHLTLPELFDTPAEQLLARTQISTGLNTALRRLRESSEGNLAALAQELESFDPTLLDPARAAGEKIQHQIGQLTGKIERSITRRGEDLRRHARHLAHWLYPENHPQERYFCAASLLHFFGPEILTPLGKAMELFQPDHQILNF